MDARSKTTLKRMAKYYPSERVVVVREQAYNEIARKVGPFINGWEYSQKERKPGRIEVEVIPVIEAANCLPDSSSVLQESGPVSCVNSTPALTKTNLTRRLD